MTLEKFKTANGLHPEGSLNPTIFNTYMNEIIKASAEEANKLIMLKNETKNKR